MLSFRGRRWEPRSQAVPMLTDTGSIAEILVGARALEARPLLAASAFTDAPAFFARLQKAVDARETVGIFGDYDCDGITSTALFVRAFGRRGMDPVVRLPHRIHDGYGIQPRHVEEMHAQGVTLLLTVDTGVTAHEAAERAAENGIDVLIVDHHHASREMPRALAIIHPDRSSGMSVPPSAATLCFALVDAWERGTWEERDIDLALGAIGTVADVMPLQGSNRTLVSDALEAIARLPECPLLRLVRLSGVEKQCTAKDIAFGIAPRINAAGRMDDPTLALHALTKGGEALEKLCLLNGERQQTVEGHLQSLLETMEHGSHPFVFAVSSAFPVGIVGLLAGKLTEQTGKPSLIGTVRGETVTASLRSPAAYPIAEALDRMSSFLLHYGGHAQAAGCTFPLANVDVLQKALIADLTARVTADELIPVSAYDASLQSVRMLTNATVQHLSALEPFGTGNPEPRFLLPRMTLQGARRVGSDGSHLQARVEGIPAIGFGLGDMTEHTVGPVDLLCRFGLNTWQNRTTPQLMIDDIRVPV